MTRSLKKGPYIDFRLRKKIDIMNDSESNEGLSFASIIYHSIQKIYNLLNFENILSKN